VPLLPEYHRYGRHMTMTSVNDLYRHYCEGTYVNYKYVSRGAIVEAMYRLDEDQTYYAF
jgi:hypothetical protein